MSHPDPLFDPDNCEDDDMNYDDYNDFHNGVDPDDRTNDYWAGDDDLENEDDSYDDDMDGDMESGFASAGWGTDEDYGCYGDDTPMSDDYYGGE